MMRELTETGMHPILLSLRTAIPIPGGTGLLHQGRRTTFLQVSNPTEIPKKDREAPGTTTGILPSDTPTMLLQTVDRVLPWDHVLPTPLEIPALIPVHHLEVLPTLWNTTSHTREWMSRWIHTTAMPSAVVKKKGSAG